MTIFDSIKYPLSNNPTAEEFSKVPSIIFLYWNRNCRSENRIEDIKRLRKLIEKYNTDECEIRKYNDNI